MAFNGTTSYSGEASTDPYKQVVLGSASTEDASSRVVISLGTRSPADLFGYREGSEESRFSPAVATKPSVPANLEYGFRSDDPATPGKFTQLDFLNNTYAGGVSGDALVGNLKRVSYANWWRGDSNAGTKRMSSAVFGYTIQTTDMPTSGTASYTTLLTGRTAFNSTLPLGGSVDWPMSGNARVTVNFATGAVTIVLNVTSFAMINANGMIVSGTNRFTASFDPIYSITGTINGSLFGPGADEIGFVFAGGGFLGGANRTYSGAVVGKKQ